MMKISKNINPKQIECGKKPDLTPTQLISHLQSSSLIMYIWNRQLELYDSTIKMVAWLSVERWHLWQT